MRLRETLNEQRETRKAERQDDIRTLLQTNQSLRDRNEELRALLDAESTARLDELERKRAGRLNKLTLENARLDRENRRLRSQTLVLREQRDAARAMLTTRQRESLNIPEAENEQTPQENTSLPATMAQTRSMTSLANDRSRRL